MLKLGFLLSVVRAQEGSCVCKILHAYIGWNLYTHKLKNKYTHARASLCTHEYKLCV